MVTLGDQVEDVFFITNSDDNALNEAEQQSLYNDLKDKLVLQAESAVSTSIAF